MPELPLPRTKTVRFNLEQNRLHVYRPELCEDNKSSADQRRSRDQAVADIQEHRKYNEPLRILMQDMSIDCYRNYKSSAQENAADEEWLTFLLVECYVAADDAACCAVGVERYVMPGYQAERNRIRQLVLATLSPHSSFPYSKMHMRKAAMIGNALAAAVAMEAEDDDQHKLSSSVTAANTTTTSAYGTWTVIQPPPTRFGRWLRMIRRGRRSWV